MSQSFLSNVAVAGDLDVRDSLHVGMPYICYKDPVSGKTVNLVKEIRILNERIASLQNLVLALLQEHDKIDLSELDALIG